MISRDDIDAFEQASGPAIKAAAKFAERRERGLPEDRWASAAFQHEVARGIKAQFVLIYILTDALQQAQAELDRIRHDAVQ
jgi:hypothetical protein